ncbi:stage II sporulation protein AA (anti-sigma F factor antagonist) [Orenia metallireducens]|uniref:STAS domain-containing protein n=1 Tax=Orenia metallireducens TaxID=1413210 RepID=UPI000D05FA83|nr:STAS domain-containing protein [Orenia metallireducens]PRX32611.1 stage II sporulation protein AA (anti-sigma F factor antagonist) [Orenia metallireducens]
MEIKVNNQDDIKVIKLIGDFDGSSANKVEDNIMPYIENHSRLIFDMGECEYVSSAGLRVLLIIAKKLKSVEGFGVLSNLSEEVQDVMEITGFSHILNSYDTVNEAINYMKKGE